MAVALALQACRATAPSVATDPSPDPGGAVSYTLVPAAGASQYQLKRSEHAFGAEPLVHDAPVYPASLLGKRLPPATISVKAIIDEQGRVSDVRDVDASSEPGHDVFFAACRDAVKRWTFSPMTVVHEYDDGHGNISQSRQTAAFSLDYAFRFEQIDGRPTVTTER